MPLDLGGPQMGHVFRAPDGDFGARSGSMRVHAFESWRSPNGTLSRRSRWGFWCVERFNSGTPSVAGLTKCQSANLVFVAKR